MFADSHPVYNNNNIKNIIQLCVIISANTVSIITTHIFVSVTQTSQVQNVIPQDHVSSHGKHN